MIKKIVAFALCMIMCLAFASCSNTEEPDTSKDDANKPLKPSVLMVEDIINQEGVYCLHADGSVTKANKLTQIEDDSWIYSGGTPLVVDRSKGDRLIYVGDLVYLSAGNGEQFEMDFFAEQFYWSGKKVNLMDIEVFEDVELEGEVKENGIFYWMNVDDFFEPLGFTFHGDASMSSAENGYILSKKPMSYSYGYYEGTKWVGTTDSNNSCFYDATRIDFKKDYVFRTDVIKGRDGYFTIDLENVDAGLYLNEFDEKGHIYAIEIK